MSSRDKVRIQTEQVEAPVAVDAPQTNMAAAGAVSLPDATAAVAEGDTSTNEAEPVKAKRGKKWVTYRGHAAVVRIEDFALRPGVPVEMPRDTAEGLLTHPFEEFEVSDEAPPPPPVEE